MSNQQKVEMVEDFDEFDDEDFEINDKEKEWSQDDEEFDAIVGALQDVVISKEYESLSSSFFKSNCQIFENDEENKMEYMPIFKNYERILDGYIQEELEKRVEGFKMARFQDLLKTRSDQIDEQLLDTLLSFTDFDNFKLLMLDYKQQYEEEQRIEQLKTIKSTRKAYDKSQKQNQTSNIFSSNKDPLADFKNFASKSAQITSKKTSSQEIEGDGISEDDLKPRFFIDCKQLQTPQIQSKKSNSILKKE